MARRPSVIGLTPRPGGQASPPSFANGGNWLRDSRATGTMPQDTEAHNLTEIEGLNQRGGRTLSVVDLIEDGTLTVELAARLLVCVADGASFLTAANPGGAGKSTLLANLLAFLPPGERIVSTGSRQVVSDALGAPPASPTCLLAHEIGSGHWYGYIWGGAARDFFRLPPTCRITTCMHADTIGEMEGILLSPPLSVDPEDFARVDLVLFMHMERQGFGVRRRVATVHEAAFGGDRRLTWCWDADSDRFEQVGDSPRVGLLAERLPDAMALIRGLVDRGTRDFAACRSVLLNEWYGPSV